LTEEKPWNERPDIWQGAAKLIEPELRPFITLSPADVRELTQEAIRAPDPVARLGALLNKRGLAKKLIGEIHKEHRMEEDKAKLLDPSTWPNPTMIRLKTQPWQNQGGQQMRFAVYYALKPLIVFSENEGKLAYASIEELVDMWSVD
jgi:hypothetical protein